MQELRKQIQLTLTPSSLRRSRKASLPTRGPAKENTVTGTTSFCSGLGKSTAGMAVLVSQSSGTIACLPTMLSPRLRNVVRVQGGQRGPQAVAADGDAELLAFVQVQQPLQLRQHLQQQTPQFISASIATMHSRQTNILANLRTRIEYEVTYIDLHQLHFVVVQIL